MSREFSLADMLRAAAGSEAAADKPKRQVADDIVALTAAAERYAAPIPFSVGQLVTPRVGSLYRDAGEPCVVLAVIHELDDEHLIPGEGHEASDPTFGARLDMRVARPVDGAKILPYWVESWMFEPYVAPEQPQPDAEVPASAA